MHKLTKQTTGKTHSDWLQDGCKLIESNRTHSTCACSHLTTFGLLSEWDSSQSNLDLQQQLDDNGKIQIFQQRVQLESIENEFQLRSSSSSNNKLLYLAKVSNLVAKLIQSDCNYQIVILNGNENS